MRIDAKEAGSELKKYDLCIIGSGPAGLTIANELKGSGISLCVLESGGAVKTPSADALRALESSGILIKEESRARVLGGASTVWSGLSSPLDDIDFEERSYLQVPGWPISRASLQNYYARAAERYGFPGLERMQTPYLALVREQGDWQGRWENIEEKVFLASDPVRNFGSDFRDIFEGEECDLLLNATVEKLETAPDFGHVTSTLVRSGDGSRWRLEARRFVLAAGGIENARLLLNSTDSHPSGLGNAHDQVGRYLMNHPKHYYGEIVLTKPVRELPYYFGYTKEGFAGYAGLRLKETVQREKGVLNSYVRFEPLYPWSDSPGIGAFVTLVKTATPLVRSWLRFQKAAVPLRDYAETGEGTSAGPTSLRDWISLMGRIVRHAIPVSRYILSRLMQGGSPRITRIRLRNFMEMEPRAENRVTLAAEKDAFGMPRACVVHECSARDKRSLIELHERLGQEVATLGFGRLESALGEEPVWPINRDASHHMGTTRMGNDPATSVVDAHCRVHGVENLYVAGASVFPTSGCANPTLTLVALAIRLAEHLKTIEMTVPDAAASILANTKEPLPQTQE